MIIVGTIEIIVTITLTNPIQILITMLGYYTSVDSFNEKSKFVGSFNIEILTQTKEFYTLYIGLFYIRVSMQSLGNWPLCSGGVCRKYINQSWIFFKCLPVTEPSKFNTTHIEKTCIFVIYVYQLWRINIFQIRSLWHIFHHLEGPNPTHISWLDQFYSRYTLLRQRRFPRSGRCQYGQ